MSYLEIAVLSSVISLLIGWFLASSDIEFCEIIGGILIMIGVPVAFICWCIIFADSIMQLIGPLT